jgi:hypothetical protein
MLEAETQPSNGTHAGDEDVLNKMVTSVPPSLSSRVTTIVISPAKAASIVSKVTSGRSCLAV